MRTFTGGVSHIARAIESDLKERHTGLQKPHKAALSDLAACVLTCRNVNSSEWIAILPRQTGDLKSKERYISRALSNQLIEPLTVMRGYTNEVLEKLSARGGVIILIMDQSKIADRFECLMVSVRVGNRAIPIAWKVVETEGAIGFDVQQGLLNAVKKMMPPEAEVLLAGDRFYGTSSLVKWCQDAGWDYRLRLKSNLIMDHEGGEITTGEAAARQIRALIGARFNKTEIQTNIGIIHEKGHPEPWIIAMHCKPSDYRTLDYGMRWGIEPMFSDFKSRGFSITKTHLKHCDRIERLILVLTIALYWAVSIGMEPEVARHTQKNTTVL
jgi:DDE family transposase